MATRAATPQVVVVGEDAATINGLRAYFANVGINACSAQSLDVATKMAPPSMAVVIFPDGLEPGEVLEDITTLRNHCPGRLLLVITGEPQLFARALKTGSDAAPCLVLPKPAFGWDVLDAIRSHAQVRSQQAPGPTSRPSRSR